MKEPNLKQLQNQEATHWGFIIKEEDRRGNWNVNGERVTVQPTMNRNKVGKAEVASDKYHYNRFGKNKSVIPDKQTAIKVEPTVKQEAGDGIGGEMVENDYGNRYIHLGQSPLKYIRNVSNASEGYPKLQRLKMLKEEQVRTHRIKPFGCKVESGQIISTLNKWINQYNIQFDVIMIGALVENQFILPILMQLPLYKLINKPGFLFIWGTTDKIKELTTLLNSDNWNKKFRRLEELVFIPIDEQSPFFPGVDQTVDQSIFTKKQWHCWMCITGTVRRATDSHLIHCNIDTDLQIESPREMKSNNNAVPDAIYKVTENFSNLNRRLHIIPTKTGYNTPIKLRPGWVIMGPDVLLDNFDPQSFEQELYSKSNLVYKKINLGTKQKSVTQYLVSQTNEIEELRPKSPVLVE